MQLAIIFLVPSSGNKSKFTGRKNPNNSINHQDDIALYKMICKGTRNYTQIHNSAPPRTSRVKGEGGQLTNAQCHMVPKYISW